MTLAFKPLAAAIFRRLPPVLIRGLLRRANTHFIVSAAGLFQDKDGRLLLLRHVLRDSYPWGLPGGFLGPGKTPEQGVIRERLNHEIFEARFFTASDLPADLPPDHRRCILAFATGPRG